MEDLFLEKEGIFLLLDLLEVSIMQKTYGLIRVCDFVTVPA